MAYSTALRLCTLAEDAEGALVWGTRAIELAQHLDDTEVLSHAQISIGTLEYLDGGARRVARTWSGASSSPNRQNSTSTSSTPTNSSPGLPFSTGRTRS